MKRLLFGQTGRFCIIRPSRCPNCRILIRKRLFTTEVPITQNTSSQPLIPKDDLISGLESEITIQKLNDMIDIEDGFDVLKDENSVLGKIMIKKCEYEMNKLIIGEVYDFDEFITFLNKLMKKLKNNRGFLRRFESGLESDYLLRVISSPRFLNKWYNDELKRIMLTGTDEMKVSRILSLMKLNELLINKLNSLKGYQLDIFDFHLLEISKLIVEQGKSYEFFEILIKLQAGNTISSHALSPVRYKLFFGSKRDKKLIYFYEIFDDAENELLKAKYVKLYSFKLLKQILIHHIQKDDSMRSKVYMDLLINRFSIEKHSKNRPQQNQNKHLLQQLYSSMMYYSTRLGNYKHSLMILDKMVENDIEITSKLCHVLITSLRKKKLYDGSLELFRILPKVLTGDKTPDAKGKSAFINELLALLREKFNDPALVLAHFATIFPHSMQLLDDLTLLNPILNRQFGRLDNLSQVRKAVLNEFFIVDNEKIYPTIIHMTELYMVLFNQISISNEHDLKSAHFFSFLFNSFIKVAEKVQAEEINDPSLKNHPFSSTNLDEGILNIFIRRVLEDFNKPKLALQMTKKFLTQVKLARFDAQKLVYLFYKHPQHTGKSHEDLVSILTYFNIDLSFQLVVANVFKCYNRGEIELAKVWYDVLLQQDYPLTNRRFIKFINAQGWEFPKSFNFKLLEYLELPDHERKAQEFAIYNDDEVLETYDNEFVQQLIQELNEIHENSKKKTKETKETGKEEGEEA